MGHLRQKLQTPTYLSPLPGGARKTAPHPKLRSFGQLWYPTKYIWLKTIHMLLSEKRPSFLVLTICGKLPTKLTFRKLIPGHFIWNVRSIPFYPPKYLQYPPPSFPPVPWAWIGQACRPTSKTAGNCSLACRLPSHPVKSYDSKLTKFIEQLTMPCIPMPCIPINPASCWVILPPMPPSMLKGLPPFSRAGDRW